MSDRARLLRALLRGDLHVFTQRVFRDLEPGTPFLSNWHYEDIAHRLTRVMRGDLRRLIVNVPPRSGKSMLTSIAWPLFLWGHDPSLRIICVSHTEDLAREFSVKRRAIAESEWYQRLFPETRLAASRDLELKTTQQGSCFATGVGGAVLGRGADVIIIDDPIKGLDALSEAARRRVNEFYDNTLLTRLNDKLNGIIVMVMQRLHEDDLVGHVSERDDWEIASFPAVATEDTVHQLSDVPGDVYVRSVGDVLHPEREPLEVLEQVKRAQGSLIYQSQYQQAPTPADGNVIQRDWLKFYDDRPENLGQIVVSWDTASTTQSASDWSVGTVWGTVGLDFYLLDVLRERLDPVDLREAIVRLSMHWEANATLIEDTELGRALAVDLRRSGELAALLHRPLYDKRARLEAQSVRFEGGQVYLPRDAPWLGAYVQELLAFPTGRHDDQVDSTSQALDWMTARAARARPIVRRNIVRRQIVTRR